MQIALSPQEIRERYANRPVHATIDRILHEYDQNVPDGKRNHAMASTRFAFRSALDVYLEEPKAPAGETFAELEERYPRLHAMIHQALRVHHGYRYIWKATAEIPNEFTQKLNAHDPVKLLDQVLIKSSPIQPGGAHVRRFNATRHRLQSILEILREREARGMTDIKFDDLQASDPTLYAETARLLYEGREHGINMAFYKKEPKNGDAGKNR